jgi:hypothetical protein
MYTIYCHCKNNNNDNRRSNQTNLIYSDPIVTAFYFLLFDVIF